MSIRKNPKWRRKPKDRPQEICIAALELFGQSGVANTTLDAIADRAGVTKGTVYLYFANKEELLRRAVREALDTSGENTRDPISSTPLEQIYDSLAHLWDFLISSRGQAVHRLVLVEQSHFPELAALYREEVIGRFERRVVQIIRRGIETRDFRDLEPEAAARMLAALALQHAYWHRSGPGALKNKSSQEVLQELADFYLQAIAATDAAFPQADGAPGPRGALNN